MRLGIAEVAVGSGRIGITCAPGRRPGGTVGADLDAIAGWGAVVVVTLMEQGELEAFGAADLGTEVLRRGMAWQHWPIRDYGVPDAAFAAAWADRSGLVRRMLGDGGRVLIHCRGGLGRSGSVVARLLVEHGMAADRAIAAVRGVRPGAIETPGQEDWVRAGQRRALPGM